MGRRPGWPAAPVAEAPTGDAALALERFLGHLSSRNASPRTIVEYRRHAAEFLAFLDRNHVAWGAPDRATVRAYLSWLAESHTPLAYLGLVGLALASRRLWPDTPDRSMVVALGVFLVALWGQYAAFQLLSSWVYLRYVVASWPALMLGVAAVALLPVRMAGKPAMAITAVAIIWVGLWTLGFTVRAGGLTLRQGEHKFAATGILARERTKEASVVIAGLYSGSMRYYGGRVTIRAEILDGEWLDRTVEWLDRRGIHTYALLEPDEVERFLARFAGQQFGTPSIPAQQRRLHL